ncbi:MAG: CsgG/HfaB family protein [Thermoanaerobaculia bacterium]|nr:CsgG/HfaB family protein [Thermoanaerobaculia bacterium]
MTSVRSQHPQICLLFVLILAWTSAAEGAPPSATPNQGGLRYTIAVESFENRSGWRGQVEIGHQLGIVLADVLNQSQRFIVVGETDLRRMGMEEQDLAASGRAASGNNTPATGHLAPAQLLVRGAITHVQHDTASDQGGLNLGRGLRVGAGRRETEINATFYIVDSTTGQIVASESVEASSRSFGVRVRKQRGSQSGEYSLERDKNLMKALTEAAEEAVAWMSQQLGGIQWQGQVVLVDGETILINRGSREGVTQGMRLVAGTLRVIRDPSNGEILDQSLEEEVASLEVERVNEKTSVCRVLTGDPRRVRQNLTVFPTRN